MTANDREWTDEQLLLTAEEAAHALNIGRTTLYALLKDGQLRSVHIGRSCRLTRAELTRFVDHLDAPFGESDRATPRRPTLTTDAHAEGLDLNRGTPTDAA